MFNQNDTQEELMEKKEKVLGIVLIVLGIFFYLHSSVFLSYFSHRNDFAHLYLAGFLAERGGDFFDPALMLKTHKALSISTGLNPFVYPPFFALLLIPLAWFSYDTAWTLFFLLSHAAYLAALALTVQFLCKPGENRLLWWGVLLGLSACFYPLPRTFSAGQMNTFILLVLTSAWFLHTRRWHRTAGAVLGLGVAIKVAPAFLLLFFAWKGRWQTVLAGALTLALTVAISLAWCGPQRHSAFLQETRQMAYGSSTWAQFNQHYHVEPHNQAPSALWYRLLTQNPSTTGIANRPTLAKALSILTALAIVAALLRLTLAGNRHETFREYSLWLIAMLLLPSLCWDHYLVQTIPILAFSLHQAWTRETRWLLPLALGLGLLAIPYYYDAPLFKQGWMTLFMAVKLLGLGLVTAFIIHNSAPPVPTASGTQNMLGQP